MLKNKVRFQDWHYHTLCQIFEFFTCEKYEKITCRQQLFTIELNIAGVREFCQNFNLNMCAEIMKPIKSERLRKLEAELHDLQQWLSLGLVPKKDIEKHKEEIAVLQARVEEEKERLQFLKDGGEAEEFIVPKRSPAKAGYNEMPTIPDVDTSESSSGMSEGGFEMETYFTDDTSFEEDTDGDERYGSEGFEEGEEKPKRDRDSSETEDESYFSDRNRWRRGGIVDPDADEW